MTYRFQTDGALRILYAFGKSTLLLCVVVLFLVGCGKKTNSANVNGDPMGLKGGGQVLQSMSNMEMLRTAINEHHQETGTWPGQLSDVGHRIPGFKVLMRNPVTGDDPGYQYVRPPQDCPPDTVILYQLRNGVADMSLPVERVGR